MRLTPLLVAALVLGGAARDASAQVSGYAIAGLAGFTGFFGSSTNAVHAAAGAEVLVRGRAGAGGEIGILASRGSVLRVSSINGVVHIMPNRRGAGASPFVSGGYTHMSSGEGSFHAWNAGAGLDIWPSDRVGIRIDVRDHVRQDRRGNVHYWSLRGGITVR